MTTPKTRYAKVDRITSRAHAIFRPSARGSQLGAREVTVDQDGGAHRGGTTYTFVSAYRLGAGDQSVFLAICALAGIAVDPNTGPIVGGGRVVDPEDDVLLELRPDGVYAEHEKPARVRTSHYRIMREAGFSIGNSGYDNLKKILRRLGSITTHADYMEGNKLVTSNVERLLTYKINDAGEAAVTISPRLAKAVIGNDGGYAKVWLTERRQLSTDIAKLLHMRFSVTIDPGEWQIHNLDNLCSSFYGDSPSPEATRKRRNAVRKALEEINGLTAWSVGEEKALNGTMVHVERDKKSGKRQGRMAFEKV